MLGCSTEKRRQELSQQARCHRFAPVSCWSIQPQSSPPIQGMACVCCLCACVLVYCSVQSPLLHLPLLLILLVLACAWSLLPASAVSRPCFPLAPSPPANGVAPPHPPVVKLQGSLFLATCIKARVSPFHWSELIEKVLESTSSSDEMLVRDSFNGVLTRLLAAEVFFY